MSYLTADHVALQDGLRRLIEREINPHIDAWERQAIFPAHQVFKLLGTAGYLGIDKPVEYGGMGLDFGYVMAFAEAVGEIPAIGLHLAIGIQAAMSTPALARYGTEELKQQFLVPTIAGDQVVCLGVSEPEAGSDVSAIRTTARKDGDDYIINGGKLWTTNGTQADWMCLLATTSDGPPHRSKSLICLPLKSRGVTVARKLDKMGAHCSDTAQLFFEDVRIPQRYRIGEEGRGFVYQMEQFTEERLWVSMTHVPPMERALQDAIEYARTRKVFGRRVIDNQGLRWRLAELKTEIEAVRSMLVHATEDHLAGRDVNALAAMIKYKAPRLLRRVADECLQFYGGMGFMNETPISRLYRDARVTSIGGGTDEVMLEIISKQMGLLQ